MFFFHKIHVKRSEPLVHVIFLLFKIHVSNRTCGGLGVKTECKLCPCKGRRKRKCWKLENWILLKWGSAENGLTCWEILFPCCNRRPLQIHLPKRKKKKKASYIGTKLRNVPHGFFPKANISWWIFLTTEKKRAWNPNSVIKFMSGEGSWKALFGVNIENLIQFTKMWLIFITKAFFVYVLCPWAGKGLPAVVQIILFPFFR